MKKAAVLSFLFLLAYVESRSQQDISLTSIVPPSPEASAFVKYGTYPTGNYTGRPDIDVPIYEIKMGSLSVPISLSYDATGIRVNEMASWVGMNWSLNAGGMISQMVVGQPDINTSTGLDAVPPRASDIVNNTTYFNYLQTLVDGDMGPLPDTQPDKFFYSFNGRSGSFVLDRNRNILQIPKTSLKISIVGSLTSFAQSFNIVDENGVTYIFSTLENTETYNYSSEGTSPYPTASGSVYQRQCTGYYLSELISKDGEHIYFTYENGLTVSRDDMYSESFGDIWLPLQESYERNSNVHKYKWNGVQRVVTIPRLTTISFPNGKVEFSRVGDRQDDAALASASRLDQITVYQKNGTAYSKLKAFKFIQGYYYSSADYGQYSGLANQTVDRNRLRLDTLELQDALGNKVANYSFTYNSTELPPKTSASQDLWGYYNGTSNSTLVPTTAMPNSIGGTTTIGGADRSSNETFIKAGILEKIVYPTGGYTYFETEAHQLFGGTSQGFSSYKSLALGQDTNNLVVQSFTTPADLTSGSGGLSITISPYSLSDPQPFVTITNTSTEETQTFTSTDNTQWYSSNIPYTFAPSTTYQITASNYVNQSNATSIITASFSHPIPDPHTTPIGGLRIKSIQNYNNDGTLAYEENYRYGENENGGGVFIGIPSYAYNYDRFQEAVIAGGGTCNSQSGFKSIFTGGALFDQALVQGSPVVYTDVVKYYGSPAGNAGKTVYNYGLASQQVVETRPLPAGQELANNQGILIINDTWKKGQLLDQQDYKRNSDGTYSLIKDDQNTYQVVYTDTTYGLLAQLKFDRIVLCYEFTRFFTDYAFAEYPVYSGYVQLAQKAERVYSQDGNSSVGTTVNYTYDPDHNDFTTVTATTNSKGDSVKTTKKYPFNKTDLQATGALSTNESTAIDAMIARNIISPVMEEIQTTAGTQTTRKRMQYEFVNGNIIAPVAAKYQTGASPIETRLQFSRYDTIGNLIQQHKSDDVNHSYIWDYQLMYPVAEVQNADSANIAYTSFEADGTGNWSVGSGAVDTTTAVTGKNSFNLTGNISKSGLNTGNTYVVSYWTQNSSAFTITGTNSGYPVKGKTINGWTLYVHRVTGQTTITVSGTGHIDELRLYPLGAEMTTYTYSPLVGMTSQTDIAGRTTYYEYDGLQRLKRIRDQDHNILKTLDYQYQFTNSCGGNCFIVPMRTLAGTNTLGYPVGVFNVHGKLLGNAAGPGTFVSLWNTDTADAHVGTLAAGGDSLHFTITLNTGKTLPSITGCRYYQVDLKWNQLDGVRNFNGAYIDFGDGNGMQMGRSDADTPAILAPNTTVKSFTYTNFLSAGVGVPFSQVYLTHTYPDTTTTRTITFYHNDDTTNSNLDNAFTPATSLLKVTNFRGNLPAMTNGLGGSCYQQSSMTSVSGITNWNKISSVTNFFLNLGDGTHGVNNIGYAQDFMQNNKGLQIIDITGASDTSFKVSRLKTGWNTYFTNLQQLIINDYQWQHEDLSALTSLWFFKFFATDPTGTSVIDNIINQIAVGAGRHINNGVINITYPGMDRTAASQSAFRMIKSKGWQVFINGVFE